MIPRLLLFVASAAAVTILALDIRSAREDPRTYELAHRMAIDDYVRRSSAGIYLALFGIVVPIVATVDRKRQRFWDVAVVALLMLGIAAALAGYFRWWRAGFDH